MLFEFGEISPMKCVVESLSKSLLFCRMYAGNVHTLEIFNQLYDRAIKYRVLSNAKGYPKLNIQKEFRELKRAV